MGMNIEVEDQLKMSHIDNGGVDAHLKFPQEKLGFSFVFATDDVTGNLTVTNLKFFKPEFDFKKEFEILEPYYEEFKSQIEPLIKEINDDLMSMVSEHLTEQFNKIIVNYKDVDHITNELYKAIGDESTGPFGDKLCVH
ncbi:hypothetical protein ACFFRR_006443 [Megaselia abdita]